MGTDFDFALWILKKSTDKIHSVDLIYTVFQNP